MRNLFIPAIVMMLAGCSKPEKDPVIRLITLDPGHFHAALVQKVHYPGVDTNVFVFAPEGKDLVLHLERVDSYNTRKVDDTGAMPPTRWAEHIYVGPDYLEKMVKQKPGNLVVIAGNNRFKSRYISRSLEAGLNVLADKPMVIRPEEFEELEQAFRLADERGVQLYDVMTERFEINSMLQRELARNPDVFGALELGSADEPAVIKESVHHFRKEVSGKPLVRPAWFFDTKQQGEGMVDVTTHLVDLVQWTCFPDEVLDYKSDVQVLRAERSASRISKRQFTEVTLLDGFPEELGVAAHDTVLYVYSNGSLTYALRGVHARVSVRWDYYAGPGRGDTHYSRMRGSRASLVIRQGAEQEYKPVLYVEPRTDGPEFKASLESAVNNLPASMKGVTVVQEGKGYRIVVPAELQTGHESHFAQVMEKYLDYLRKDNMPDWEVPGMLTKYYTTTQALRIANQNP